MEGATKSTTVGKELKEKKQCNCIARGTNQIPMVGIWIWLQESRRQQIMMQGGEGRTSH